MNTIQLQFDQMLQRGIIPCFEYPITLNGEKEWLLVDLVCLDHGIEFSFDSNSLPVFFEGSIVSINDNRYLLPFDNYSAGENDSDDLDYYLQAIAGNIQDGFIAANNLFCNEE